MLAEGLRRSQRVTPARAFAAAEALRNIG